MASPLVSVLLTVYNRERYLAESIDSVLAQSFADFELIVVDDCSTDRSLEIAREYERRDKRIRVIPTPTAPRRSRRRRSSNSTTQTM
jgi:glycosyltransferase involved in cell wall biosynthesis